jgi:hypothetical protein
MHIAWCVVKMRHESVSNFVTYLVNSIYLISDSQFLLRTNLLSDATFVRKSVNLCLSPCTHRNWFHSTVTDKIKFHCAATTIDP